MIMFEVDEFWLSTTCLSDLNIVWIHRYEKKLSWKERKENCSCVTNSSVPSVRCGNVVFQFMF